MRGRVSLHFLAGAALVLTSLLAPEALAAQGGRPGGGGGPPARVSIAPADVLFPAPTDIEFEAGFVDHGGVSITIEPRGGRNSWQLFLQASAADMGGYGKPVGDLLVRVEGSSTWTPLGTTAQMVAEGSGNTTVTVFYRLELDWAADVPGSYTVPLEYSANSF